MIYEGQHQGRDGKLYNVYRFETFADLEHYFLTELLGAGLRSKVIGKMIIVEANQ